MSDGSTVNVLYELELEGDEDIWTQLLKLSEDNLNEPEQDVFEVFVVTEVVSIASEKVTEMLSVIETPLWLSVGEIDETVWCCSVRSGGCIDSSGGSFLFLFTTGNDGETKKKYGENEEYMSHLVSYKWIRKTQFIPEYVVFYNNVGIFTWSVSDCEELSGG